MNSISPTVKGIIAIMLTLLVVIIVIMLFVKSLFINDNSKPKKTGTMTSTEYIPTETTTTTEAPTETKKKKTTEEEKNDDQENNEEDGDAVGEITCTGPVYLHPEPNSSSANLTTIPSGAVCKYYKNEIGWYYVEYQGQKGYAWKDFFTAPPA